MGRARRQSGRAAGKVQQRQQQQQQRRQASRRSARSAGRDRRRRAHEDEEAETLRVAHERQEEEQKEHQQDLEQEQPKVMEASPVAEKEATSDDTEVKEDSITAPEDLQQKEQHLSPIEKLRRKEEAEKSRIQAEEAAKAKAEAEAKAQAEEAAKAKAEVEAKAQAEALAAREAEKKTHEQAIMSAAAAAEAIDAAAAATAAESRLESKHARAESQNGGTKIIISMSDDDNERCAVCGDGSFVVGNLILQCSMCLVFAHQACVCVGNVPDGDWFCRHCEMIRAGKVLDGVKTRDRGCQLCPNKGGILVELADTDFKLWAHVMCVIWVPHVSFAELKEVSNATGFTSPSLLPFYEASCGLCRRMKAGASIPCKRIGCYRAYHVTCAMARGIYIRYNLKSKDHIELDCYCREHEPSKPIDPPPNLESMAMKPPPPGPLTTTNQVYEFLYRQTHGFAPKPPSGSPENRKNRGNGGSTVATSTHATRKRSRSSQSRASNQNRCYAQQHHERVAMRHYQQHMNSSSGATKAQTNFGGVYPPGGQALRTMEMAFSQAVQAHLENAVKETQMKMRNGMAPQPDGKELSLADKYQLLQQLDGNVAREHELYAEAMRNIQRKIMIMEDRSQTEPEMHTSGVTASTIVQNVDKNYFIPTTMENAMKLLSELGLGSNYEQQAAYRDFRRQWWPDLEDFDKGDFKRLTPADVGQETFNLPQGSLKEIVNELAPENFMFVSKLDDQHDLSNAERQSFKKDFIQRVICRRTDEGTEPASVIEWNLLRLAQKGIVSTQDIFHIMFISGWENPELLSWTLVHCCESIKKMKNRTAHLLFLSVCQDNIPLLKFLLDIIEVRSDNEIKTISKRCTACVRLNDFHPENSRQVLLAREAGRAFFQHGTGAMAALEVLGAEEPHADKVKMECDNEDGGEDGEKGTEDEEDRDADEKNNLGEKKTIFTSLHRWLYPPVYRDDMLGRGQEELDLLRERAMISSRNRRNLSNLVKRINSNAHADAEGGVPPCGVLLHNFKKHFAALDMNRELKERMQIEKDYWSHCEICRGGDSLHGNLIVICDGCEKGYHELCHPLPIDILREKWYCTNCQKKSELKKDPQVKHEAKAMEEAAVSAAASMAAHLKQKAAAAASMAAHQLSNTVVKESQ